MASALEVVRVIRRKRLRFPLGLGKLAGLGRGGQGADRWKVVVGAILLAAIVLVGAVGQENPWKPSLPTGREPISVVAIPGGVAVVCRGPHPETLQRFQAELQKRISGATGATRAVLEELQRDLETISTVTLFSASPDGRLWPYREYLLYEISQTYLPSDSPPKTTTVKTTGAASGAAVLKRGAADVLLVGTTGPVFEVNLSTGELRIVDELPRGVVSLASGDLDGDGQLELVVVHAQSVSAYGVTGDRFELWKTWRGGQGGELGFNPSFVAIADMNRDGAGDILVANDGQAELVDERGEVRTFRDLRVHVILSERARQFRAPDSYAAASRPRMLAVADFSGDGVPDVVVAGAEAVVILEGVGDGALRSVREVIRWDVPNEVVPGTTQFQLPPATLVGVDLNRDGVADLVVADPATGRITVFDGPYNSGRFRSSREIFASTRPTGVLVHSVGGDDYPELLVVDGSTNELFGLVQHQAGFSQAYPLGEWIGPVSLSLTKGSSPLYMVVPSGLLREQQAVSLTTKTDTFPRAGGLPPDEETSVKQLYYTFYDRAPLSVDPLVVQGGALAGAPAASGEAGDGSLAVVFDRLYTGPRPLDEVPPKSGVVGTFPRGAVFGDLSPHDPLDLLVVFADGSMRAVQNPWPRRATPRTITLPSLPPGVLVAAVALADLDADPKDDLIVVDRKTADVYVLLNWVAPWVRYVGSGVGPVGVEVADLDGDGNVDLAIVNSYSNDVTIFWGRGNGTLLRHQERIPVGARPVALAAAKQTPDGVGSVLLTVNSGSDSVSAVAFQGRSVKVVTIPLGRAGPVAVAAATTLDWLAGRARDQYPDFAVVCYGDNELVLLLGKGGGEFEVVPIRGDAQLSNIVGYPVARRGDGPMAVAVADFDGDGQDDVAFSVAFPRERLQLDPSRVAAGFYSPPVKTLLEGLWQDVFMLLSRRHTASGSSGARGQPPVVPPPLPPTARRGVVDVAVAEEDGRPAIVVLGSGPKDGDPRQISLFRLGLSTEGWTLGRQFSVGPTVTRVLAADLNWDGRSDLVVLDPRENVVEILWGPQYSSPTRLPTSGPTAVVAVGSSSQGSWLLAGERLWVSQPLATTFGPFLTLKLGGGEPRDAAAILPRHGRGPPDLLILTTRDEARLFSGRELLAGKAEPSLVLSLLPGTLAARAVGAYLDEDDAVDVIFSSFGRAEAVHVRFGTGRYLPLGSGELAAAWTVGTGDFDSDGMVDIVTLMGLPNGLGVLRLFAGKGDGGFVQPAATWFRAGFPWSECALEVGDVDGDGRPDVVVWERYQDAVWVFWHRDLEMERVVDGVRFVARRLELGLWRTS